MDALDSQTPDSRIDTRDDRPQAQRQGDLGGLLWRTVLHPAALVATALVLLLLVVAAALLPQLPDQLRDEPAAAARWLLTTATTYGSFGGTLRGAGLFNVLDSLLFRLTLAGLAAILAAHLIDQIGNAVSLQRLRRKLCSLPVSSIGRNMVAISRSLRQQRIVANIEPAGAERSARRIFEDRFVVVDDCRYTASNSGERPESILANVERIAEYRSLGVSNGLSYWLRPLLPLGVLVAFSVVWLYLYFGWEMHAPVLAPGDNYRLPSREVAVAYAIEPESLGPEATGELLVRIGAQVYTGTIEGNVRAHLGASRILAQSGEQALLIRDADGEPILAEPGQSDTTDSVGVVLPGPGSEESILLPSLSSGLRIVRRTEPPDTFFVELYQGAEIRPRQRIEVDGPTIATIANDDETLDLELIPVRGMSVSIRHIPGLWLLWIALALSAFGFYGVIQPPSVALAQIAQWTDLRTLVTIRASESDDIDAISTALNDKISGGTT